MLIASIRHTTDDLKRWREYEAADHHHVVNWRPAADEVQQFAKEPCYCSVSWGKDSVVVAWLVATVAPHVPLVWVRPEGAECPGCEDVRDQFLAAYDLVYHEPRVHWSIWNDMTISNEVCFQPAVAIAGTTRRIVGVRANESGRRKISMRFHGLATAQVCRPIGWWTEQDVFAIHAQHSLPTHPNYAMVGGGRWKRSHLRVDALGGDTGAQFGRAEWEQEYYGDVLARMAISRRG